VTDRRIRFTTALAVLMVAAVAAVISYQQAGVSAQRMTVKSSRGPIRHELASYRL
jgi:hypothetical protein